MTAVYRAPIRSRTLDVLGADWALAHGLVAMDAVPERVAERFAAVEEGAFVWTRDGAGRYRLGRIRGPAGAAPENGAGLRLARPAQWHPHAFAADEAPARVVYAFSRGGRNFQRVRDAAAERATAALWDAG